MRKSVIVSLFLIVLILVAAFQILRPLPFLRMQAVASTNYHVPGSVNIQWPAQGAAAIQVNGVLMGSWNGDQPLALASVAKLMTAYLTLRKHPLATGADGPVLTISADDVATYKADVADQNSVAKVALGEKITERQLLEALLIPSGDNIATLLAKWDAGSVAQFVQEMNRTAVKLGMTHTHYADPAGVSLETVGSALDQLKIAQADMAIPAFRHIVRMKQAKLPFGPTVYNTDYVLGKNGIIGIKTGSMPEAGGNFVFGTQPWVNGQKSLVIGCVMAQQGGKPLMNALQEGASLAQQASANLQEVSLVKTGAKVAEITSAWGQTAPVDATKDLSMIVWPGLSVKESLHPTPLGRTVEAKAAVGQWIVTAGNQSFSIPVQTSESITNPTLLWKLKRIR
ncbi:MAG: D-alanyl-D-alanine carboxypeptidase family protein [Syntrophobacteraceae bacterium]